MKRYILNSAVISTPGVYSYKLIDAPLARLWLGKGPFESAVGYQETADALSFLTGVNIPVNRATFNLATGDEALVFRLVFPAGSPRLPPGQKGALSQEFILANCEIGILLKTS